MNDQQRLEIKLDKVTDHLSSIDATLAVQHESLKLHIKRSDALEKQVLELSHMVSYAKGSIKTMIGIFAVLEVISRFFLK